MIRVLQPTRADSGLTLVEVLVAGFLLASITAASFGAIRSSWLAAASVEHRNLAVGLAREAYAELSAAVSDPLGLPRGPAVTLPQSHPLYPDYEIYTAEVVPRPATATGPVDCWAVRVAVRYGRYLPGSAAPDFMHVHLDGVICR